MVLAICCRSRGWCVSDSTHFGTHSDAHVGCNTLLYFLLTSSFLGLTLSPNRLSEEQFPPAWKRSTPRGERFSSRIEPWARRQTNHSRLNQSSYTMRAVSPPVPFSLRSLSSATVLRHAGSTRLAVVYLLFTVTLMMVPKADISETPFDEANTPTNEIVVTKAASSWEHLQSVTALVPRIFAQPRTTIVRTIFPFYAGRLIDTRMVREILCSLLC
jgi:hypothetical protein